MHPPSWVVEELQKINPSARLGWLGRPKQNEGDDNPGNFVLLQIVHKAEAANSFDEPWNERGPVFGAGWDRLSHVPVMKSVFEMNEDVFSGAALKALRYYMRSADERIREQRLARGTAIDDQVKDMAGEAGEKLYWDSQRTDAASNRVRTAPNEEEKALLRGERKRDLRGIFLPQTGSL